MAYEYYNPNPEKKIVGDCVIQSQLIDSYVSILLIFIDFSSVDQGR